MQLHPQEALLQQARALQQSEALVRLIWSHCLGGAGCCWGLFINGNVLHAPSSWRTGCLQRAGVAVVPIVPWRRLRAC